MEFSSLGSGSTGRNDRRWLVDKRKSGPLIAEVYCLKEKIIIVYINIECIKIGFGNII